MSSEGAPKLQTVIRKWIRRMDAKIAAGRELRSLVNYQCCASSELRFFEFHSTLSGHGINTNLLTTTR